MTASSFDTGSTREDVGATSLTGDNRCPAVGDGGSPVGALGFEGTRREQDRRR